MASDTITFLRTQVQILKKYLYSSTSTPSLVLHVCDVCKQANNWDHVSFGGHATYPHQYLLYVLGLHDKSRVYNTHRLV